MVSWSDERAHGHGNGPGGAGSDTVAERDADARTDTYAAADVARTEGGTGAGGTEAVGTERGTDAGRAKSGTDAGRPGLGRTDADRPDADRPGSDRIDAEAEAYWRDVLSAGGFTALPRWAPEATGTTGDAPAIAAHRTAIPAELADALTRTAAELAVPAGALLLAAHVKVMAALTGDREVVTGRLTTAYAEPLPCRVVVEDGPWHELIRAAADVAAAADRHHRAPLAALRAELRRADALFDTVLVTDRDPAEADLAPDTLLAVGVAHGAGAADATPAELVLLHRPHAVNGDFAARVAGYHLAALAALTTDPGAPHHERSLLSADELTFQLHDLAGPERELPDRRFHELFEERVRLHPDAVAAECGGERWTYDELNRRANRIARALRGRGLRDEDVVAVAAERGLPWLAAVVAVFKAGGAYLPIEPHLPPDRIATVLDRSGARWALARRENATALDEAVAGLESVHAEYLDTVLAEDHEETDLGLAVGADQLAYIYFTSGSTGLPKGAMCEHAGFLNHLFAKIEDLGVAEGRVVAQTAPQGFDISLWQLVAALVVGGTTLIVEQDVVLDVRRFVDKLDTGRVEVVQLVPSYLEVILSYLEQHPRELPALRCVSATGEALKKELVERWFATFPGVKVVNAYGLTETCDDTNHEVMDRVPDHPSVPLGPPVRNVRVLIVDERLEPVPLGAPGEIVFSGVCVGRGYINDPERTRAAFVPDPRHPGGRLYRSGDFGRWLPDGKLEFLGRRDAQVKIRGFRIETGEIENTLLRIDGVRDGAVVVAGADEGKHLVAFYAADAGPAAERVREHLAGTLPAFMVPDHIHRREALPLTPNGKIDKKALTRLANELSAARAEGAGTGSGAAPTTDAERRLAALWAAALKVPEERIGRLDHFFETGGTSLSALRLVIALDRRVTVKEIAENPVLADLAALVDRRAAAEPVTV
ncbi:amino acid adenylation domain-containing protein [Streptomyces sp. URMC 123]|uniref:amino acid adenylation domain-containing protein n=2 Tax=unclassified Streptomyces TaxID=2593676 RepID=UPI003F1D1832